MFPAFSIHLCHVLNTKSTVMKGKYFLAFLTFALTLANGCKERQPADFSEYISGYTGGVISSSSPITIYLNLEPDKKFRPGSVLPAGILDISPSVKGETMLKDDGSIEFIPAEPFENGETYRVLFDLGTVCNVPEEYRKFRFRFEVIPLSVAFDSGELSAEADDGESLKYQASLRSSDRMPEETIEGMVKVTYQNRKITPEWLHDGNMHQFTLRKLAKGDDSRTLTIEFGKDVKDQEPVTVRIPGKNEFTVLNVKATESDPAVVSIFMSENVSPDQDLRGLIGIEGTELSNFKIEGNKIQAFLPTYFNMKSERLTLYPGIRSAAGNTLKNEYQTTVTLYSTKPGVRLPGKGVIVPDRNQTVIPFSTMGLKAVDVELIQVPYQNMNFFLQENSYDNNYELMRTARPVFTKRIDLLKDHPDLDPDKWNDFTIDLSKMVKLEKGTVYRIRFKFKKSYTTLPCADEAPDSDYGTVDWDNSNGYSYYSEYSYPTGFDWKEQNNPCHVSYYTGNRFVGRNLINTSLGIMAKQGADNRYFISVNDISTAEPVEKCRLFLFNYQNQKIDSAETDRNGFAYLTPSSNAFVVMAQSGSDRAWLKLSNGMALSLSNFDVSGQEVQRGVKGFIYGERGVWRPGDEILLSLILEDKLNVLPEGHPIVARLTDPNGHTVQTLKDKIGKNNIYCFTFKTPEDARTGYWNAVFMVGGLTFSQTLRVETVKPNRMAIQMELPNREIIGKGVSTAPIKVNTRWLNGASAPDRKAVTEVRLYNGNHKFAGFQDYVFYDQSGYFEPATCILFNGNSNAQGSFSIDPGKIKADNAPGVLNASFTTRVFENGGDFSTVTETVAYSPYTRYVGIRLPDTKDNWHSTKKPVTLSGVTVSPTGKQTGNSSIRIDVYRLDWHWWWDARDENISSYVNRNYSKSIISKNVIAENGAFSTELTINDYGRYFIRAQDSSSGHTAGIIAYFGSWEESSNQDNATMLLLSTDKKSYRVGEKIKVTFPSSAGGVAIISEENGKEITDIHRMPTKSGTTTFELEANSGMCPNTYIAVTLLQPHSTRDNDRPIRMYGVINVDVENPDLHLNPAIKIPAELRPSKEFTVEVSEKNGKPMNYTIAVVDEGLLSLTSFRTPDPFRSFYAREALGVKTWDFYDYIYGAYGVRLDRAFAIGGGESIKRMQDEKTNRFKPVVLFDGPFSLKAGQTGRHTFRMPEYIGEVRTMVVAAENGRYGSTSVNSTVKKPLMVSIAMPRLFTPGDITDIPVTVFAMDDNIREVAVRMSSDEKVTLLDSTVRTIRFDKNGEKVVWFKARINRQTGVTTLRTEARSGNERTTVSEEVSIRIPNPRITSIEEKEAGSGKAVSFNTAINGVQPASVLEISSIPPLNLEHRLNYLLEYPHGCAEQITSKAFPQLSLPDLLSLSPEESLRAESNIREAIDGLRKFQTAEGGFAYWPGNIQTSEWVTSYIVQFLITAKRQGYSVPARMLQNALNYIRRAANGWYKADPYSQQQQAYRLFVLALAGKPDMAAMNRLKESRATVSVTRWLLSSAYALSNHTDMARKMVADISSEVTPYRETGGTYGSTTRDNALILQSMVILDMQKDAYRMLQKISQAMGSDEWYNTQETAFALHSAAEFVRKYLGTQRGIQVTVSTAGGEKEINTGKTVFRIPLPILDNISKATVKNKGQGTLFVSQVNSSASLDVVKEKVMSGLDMTIRYYNDQGNQVNVRQIKQSEDITAEITVKNTGVTGTYHDLALTYSVPSGFEIINERLTGNAAMPGADNVNIRDDSFLVYFSLDQNRSKTFKFRCNAAFRGEYMIPAIRCSAMYDNGIQAVLPGGTVKIE